MSSNASFVNYLLATLVLCHGILGHQANTIPNPHGRTKRAVGSWSPSPAHTKRAGRNGDPNGTPALTSIRCGLQYDSHDFKQPDSVSCQSDIFWKYKCTRSKCHLPGVAPPFQQGLNMNSCNNTGDDAQKEANVEVWAYTVDLPRMVVTTRGYKDGDIATQLLALWVCDIVNHPENGVRPECDECEAFWYEDEEFKLIPEVLPA